MPEENSTTTEEAPESTTQGEQNGSETEQTSEAKPDPNKAVLADLAKERRERKRLAQELEAERAKGLSESERAIAAAKAEGAQEAALAAGKRLARAEIRAAAASAGLKVDDLLDDLDLSRFVGDDGEPDDAAIQARIKRWAAIAPESNRPRGSVDQGNRGRPPAQSNAEAFASFLQNQLRSSQ